VQHPDSYSDRIVRPKEQYQDVVVTVNATHIYVNVNGYQAVGETSLAEQNLGAKEAYLYTSNPVVNAPGRLGLQIHDGQNPMNVRFKRIAILEGCGNASSPNYDGAFVAGLPKQPAVYQDNGSCVGTPVRPGGGGDAARSIGAARRIGSDLIVGIQAEHHAFELVSLQGRVLFSAFHPAAKEYHIPVPARPGVYVAKVKTKTGSAVRKLVVP
jgi:hypothetical protein